MMIKWENESRLNCIPNCIYCRKTASDARACPLAVTFFSAVVMPRGSRSAARCPLDYVSPHIHIPSDTRYSI